MRSDGVILIVQHHDVEIGEKVNAQHEGCSKGFATCENDNEFILSYETQWISMTIKLNLVQFL